MSTLSLVAKLEALLFLYGDPIERKKAADILGVSLEALNDAAKGLSTELEKAELRGLTFIEDGARIQLGTKPALGSILKTIVEDEFDAELTPAALETLTIVSYAAPATRAEIDYIRGVNSSYILRTLLIRGLIERHTGPGGAYMYAPTFDLLRHLGISRAEDLPEFATYRGLIAQLRGDGRTVPIESPSSS